MFIHFFLRGKKQGASLYICGPGIASSCGGQVVSLELLLLNWNIFLCVSAYPRSKVLFALLISVTSLVTEYLVLRDGTMPA